MISPRLFPAPMTPNPALFSLARWAWAGASITGTGPCLWPQPCPTGLASPARPLSMCHPEPSSRPGEGTVFLSPQQAPTRGACPRMGLRIYLGPGVEAGHSLFTGLGPGADDGGASGMWGSKAGGVVQ